MVLPEVFFFLALLLLGAELSLHFGGISVPLHHAHPPLALKSLLLLKSALSPKLLFHQRDTGDPGGTWNLHFD